MRKYGFLFGSLLCLFLLSGCFLTELPGEPPAAIAASAGDGSIRYAVTEDDWFSCMTIHLPERKGKNAVPAVVIFPGGGYGVLAMEKEGRAYASFFNSHGIAAVVVKYPLGSILGHFRRHPDMLNTALESIRLLRKNAVALHIDPARVGVMGSSAGGHLAGMCAVYGKKGETRPDFAILCYPVVSMKEDAHAGSRRNLLGAEPSEELLIAASLELQIRKDLPPFFVWHTREDQVVNVSNSERLIAALKKANVPHRAVIYEHGPHGMGLLTESQQKRYPETAQWKTELLSFLRERGVLEK